MLFYFIFIFILFLFYIFYIFIFVIFILYVFYICFYFIFIYLFYFIRQKMYLYLKKIKLAYIRYLLIHVHFPVTSIPSKPICAMTSALCLSQRYDRLSAMTSALVCRQTHMVSYPYILARHTAYPGKIIK